ncbi:MAG: histidinol-phosphatase [candidate division Zixibacteria bacterium CG_4_9_14_3_um_filter_46_8]|nr:MAG: histidinol-phosphatase [candidate division Zixibacteria bacterium CG_4_9_14_3_um_filter_46_8]
MTLKNYAEGKEGFYGKTLVVIGYEVHDPDNRNHYLLFGLDKIIEPGLRAANYVAQGASKGALGIIAHPDEIRGHLPQFPSYPWTEWDIEGFNGIEIWNHMSEWMEGLKKYNKLNMLISPRRSLKSPTDRILRIWDELNLSKKIAGIGSIDVHGFPYKVGFLKLIIFPYKVQFKSIRTHLLLNEQLSGDLEVAKRQIYDAIRECRLFISNYRWGNANNFRMEMILDDKKIGIGDTGMFCEGAKLQIDLPLAGEMTIIRNGKLYGQFNGSHRDFPISSKGLYRAEIKRGGKGWIYTNHIRVE